jgi:hypothetical protein
MLKMPTDGVLSSKNSVANIFQKVEIASIAMKLTIRRELGALIAVYLLSAGNASLAADLEDWTLEQVLGKVVDSNGGQDSIDSMTNVRLSGSVEGVNSIYDFVLLKKRPNKLRMRFMFRGAAIESGFDGEVGWRRQSRGDQSQVVVLEGKELAGIRLESDFDGPLIGKLQEGVQLKLNRIERIGRVDYFVIRAEYPMRVSDHYIDSRTFRELKVVSSQDDADGNRKESVNHYKEYKKHGGIWVAHLVVRTLPNGNKENIRIENVEVNPGILDLVFDKPE